MNGTYVNEEKVGKGNARKLKNGDKISLIRLRNGKHVLGYFFREISS